MSPKKKAVQRKTAARKKTVTKKAPVKKAAAKKTVARKKRPATKAAAKQRAPAKKTTQKKTVAKKASAPAKRGTATQKPLKKTAAGKSSESVLARRRIGEPAVHSTAVPGIAPYKGRKGERYMNNKQVAHFREILEAWKHELMEEVDRTVHHMQDEAANFPDPNDRATQESEFSMELRTRDRERKLIKKIDESLANLERDEYGYCESCGVEIGVRRLEARPTASLCIDCKTLDEIREKQQTA